jgi:hypothetical protein
VQPAHLGPQRGARLGWLAQTALLVVQALRADGFPWGTAAGALNNLDTAAAEWVAAVRTTLRDGDEETRKRARDLLKRAGNGGIQSAAHDGQVEVVTGLLDGGIEVDALDKHKRTALHWAAQGDKPEVAKLLLAKGADKARAVASKTLARAYDAIGLLPAG